MSSFGIRKLEETDTQALLAFEVRNREWFESRIDARDPAFYSLQGVTGHIRDYLCGFADGIWHPFVIEDEAGNIVGRANLKDIDSSTGTAEVGYRVGQDVGGQGLATLALRHLIEQAQQHWKLTQLVAYVYRDNVGSRKVLDRCGFLMEQQPHENAADELCRFVLSI
ncbi:ribosomal-protein-alanine N-acetyltransferase [Pseudomonas asplenii]|uniref:Ribosomal-protein-alanine N-acetyltransferase n=1 Tax=Pseudomonas asplenii TaxID=53407 RepID=A0A1H1YMS4_9PSED|nr:MULTISPECIES: GNAT family N-acetyltransferase [Pseudomonas]SDT22675.1 ribosomal-protein-alanine N-acetyltransferase [Pseudomonas asplenii]SEI19605.1 ribosomal-protein-alanine N-acetyltransferase [Pseudomonas fuscovaginae]